MSRSQPPLSPEVRALLDREREIPPLPETVRARAMARARAALVAGVAARRSGARAPRTRWAAAAAVIGILSVAVGAAAYQIRAHLAPAPSTPAASPRRARRGTAAAPRRGRCRRADRRGSRPRRRARPAKPTLSRADAARAELHLLRQARAAVAREDFAAALPPIAEHARRFKDGRLAEEREALRVKALAGLGRTEEARRAAAAFRARFPRSVLLPAVSQMSPSQP